MPVKPGLGRLPSDDCCCLSLSDRLSASMQAGGRASDGKRRILDIQPEKLHQRLPLFLGSPDDIAELESYEDVQQINNPGYTV